MTSNPAELWAICQAMQFQRREMLELIRDVCLRCGIREAPTSSEDPRPLLEALCKAHLELRERAEAPRTPPASRRSNAELQAQEVLDAEAQIRDLQERLERSEAKAVELETSLEESRAAAAAGVVSPLPPRRPVRTGSLGTSPAERCYSSATQTAATGGLLGGISATPGHYDSSLSMLSVSFSPGGGCDSPEPEVDVSAHPRPFAEALAALQPLLEESAAKASPGGALPPGEGLARLSLAERLDLLDLASAVRNAEPMLLEAAAAFSETEGQQSQQSDVQVAQPAASPVPAEGQYPRGLSRASLASSCASSGSLPAAGRLTELAEEKLREVLELQGRRDCAQSAEARLEAETLLAAASEELRLLREYAGLKPANANAGSAGSLGVGASGCWPA